MIYFRQEPAIKAFEVNGANILFFNEHPLTFYAYAFIGIALLGIIIKEIFSDSKVTGLNFYMRCSRKRKIIFYVALICLLGIDIFQFGFHGKRLAYHWKTYSNLSLDESRAFVTKNGIYEFALFCHEKIPQAQPIKVFAHDTQTIYKQLAYYLYPLDARRKHSLDDVDYIIIFHASSLPGEEELKNFQYFAIYKEGEIILKRRNKREEEV